MNPRTAAQWIDAHAWAQKAPGIPPILAQEAAKRAGVALRKARAYKAPVRAPKALKAGKVGYRLVNPPSIPKLKKELDRVFSIWIRIRNGNPATGMVKCVTCGRQDHWKNMHCGHYVPRQDLPTRWDEVNCQVQGAECNTFRGGEPEKFAAWLDANYGDGAAAGLRSLARIKWRPSRDWYQTKIAHYKTLIGEAKPAEGGTGIPQNRQERSFPSWKHLP